MAKQPEITVAVERAIHDALRSVAQMIWDEHRVRVERVSFSYTDLSVVGQYVFRVNEVEIVSITYAYNKQEVPGG